MRIPADIGLMLVPLLWGVTFPLIRMATSSMDAYSFVFWRFLCAFLVFLAIFLVSGGAKWHKIRNLLLPCLWLSFLAWVSYLTQTIGLGTISSARSAFITGTNVIMVPLIAPFFKLHKPKKLDYTTALLATFGLMLMTNAWNEPFSAGDLWTLVCAFAYALYILWMQLYLERYQPDALVLSFLQIMLVTFYSALMLPVHGFVFPPRNWQMVMVFIFCSIFATIVTFWLQSHFQKQSTPERTALIFATEPLFAAVFAYVLINETMTSQSIWGGGVIFLAIVTSEIGKTLTRSSKL